MEEQKQRQNHGAYTGGAARRPSVQVREIEP